jgi:uncharacterized membrane protein YphA (DoxX/SURF4 family)
MFPDGPPGNALLLLRVTASGMLIHDGVAALEGGSSPPTVIVQSVLIASGALLLVGLWTPIAGGAITAVETYFAIFGSAHFRSALLLCTVGVALALLGPGFRSIDAKLYGRRRVDVRGGE